MTREEALEILTRYKEESEEDYYVKRAKALTMAIKALEHPEKNVVAVVPCGDCISRTEVLKLIYDYKEKHSENHKEHPINYGTLLDMIRWVRDLPSVTPQEPRKGKWIVEKVGSYLGKRNGCCSVCKDFYTNDWNLMNYCPNCGADMREVEK